MTLQEQLSDIKKQFRLAMNGVASQSMREKGLLYKINFGIELNRLKEIASLYEKNHDLAQALWKEDIRESKLLAGMLQPIDSFFPEIAEIWIDNTPYPEIAEITTMTLFQYLPYAPSRAFEWIADEREMFQYYGFLLAARLFIQKYELSERAESEFLDQAQAAIESETYLPRKAAVLALKKYAMNSQKKTDTIIKLISPYKTSEKAYLRGIYEEINFEIE